MRISGTVVANTKKIYNKSPVNRYSIGDTNSGRKTFLVKLERTSLFISDKLINDIFRQGITRTYLLNYLMSGIK